MAVHTAVELRKRQCVAGKWRAGLRGETACRGAHNVVVVVVVVVVVGVRPVSALWPDPENINFQ